MRKAILGLAVVLSAGALVAAPPTRRALRKVRVSDPAVARALEEAGATVVGVATVVDRATGAQEAIETEGVPYRALLGLADLGLG